MTPTRFVQRFTWAAAALAALAVCPATAFAQLDPLLALKKLPPNVIIVVDTSFPMLTDGNGNYYDPRTYIRSDDTAVATALGVSSSTYRRVYQTLLVDSQQDSTHRFTATNIVATPDTDPSFFLFYGATRLGMAKTAISQVVGENNTLVKFGLMRLRQKTPAWNTVGNGCEKPVIVSAPALQSSKDTNPCNIGIGIGTNGRYGVYPPTVAQALFSTSFADGLPLLVAPGSTNATLNIMAIANRNVQDVTGTSLIPTGRDTANYVDRPIDIALQDARAQAIATMAAQPNATRACCNTVIVLITGGTDSGDPAYMSSHDPAVTAASFAAVTAGSGSGAVTRRVPIVVIAVKPNPADVVELQAIASASGGAYFQATSAAEVARALNYGVQMGFQSAADLDAVRPSEHSYVSPIVGTVNLVNASSATGGPLANTDITSLVGQTAGQALTQRANMMVTAGFTLPGFDGRVRAFRTFAPVTDPTKPTGWKFVKDGTRLWPDLDDRPWLIGQARVPLSSAARNIYTYLPNGAGGGTVVAFNAANAALLAPHLGGADPAVLIPFIRDLPLGAVVGSTPAIMDPPSLDPPPDTEYGFSDTTGTYAGDRQNRRSMLFFGANDGMIDGVDARTGYEVWAFIPYNLLPKLRTLLDGQSVEQFDYFVDSSPKLADVKLGGVWRTMLVIGQSYGGVFYQAFDVSDAGMGVPPDADGISAVDAMLSQFDSPNESITFKWAFPNYSQFDPNINFTAGLNDGFPGGRIRLYGDLKNTASVAERFVGFTWSDPAVGPLTSNRSVNAVITGSGYFPDIEHMAGLQRGGGSAPKAGRVFYMIDADTGLLIGNPSGSACNGTGCLDVGIISNPIKNAIQADVTASGAYNSPVVTRAYVGDLDGRYWRMDLNSTGGISQTLMFSTGQPIYSSSAMLFVGSAARYLFFGTGSDMLAAQTPGGSGTFKLYGLLDGSGTPVFAKDLDPVSGAASASPTNGERPTSAPTVAGDIVFFTTTTDTTTVDCITEATSRLYAFTYLGSAAYDSNGNGNVSPNESPVVSVSAGRATAPFIVDQHLFMSTTQSVGVGVVILGDSEDFNNGVGQIGLRILSWREIR